MLTLKDVALAINNKLSDVLSDVPVQSKDISEGFKRPSLYVDFDNVTTSDYIGDKRERSIQVIIYFFPGDANKSKIEILDVQEVLENAFIDGFMINDGFAVYPFELNSVKVDGVLQFSFEIYTLESKYDETTDTTKFMEELNLDIEGDC